MKTSIALLLVAAAALVSFPAGYLSNYQLIETHSIPLLEANKYNYEEAVATVDMQKPSLTLSSHCREISMDILDSQAFSIFFGQQHYIENRPLTHDTMKNIFDVFNISISMIKIDSREGEIFKARIILQKDDTIADIDARPTDAVALAVRFNQPVFVKSELFDLYGKKTC